MFFTNVGAVTDREQNHDDSEISLESMQMINESLIQNFLDEEERTALLESYNERNSLLEDEVVTERTLVRFDKASRINQIQKVSIFTIAKEKNDPMFKKLLTIWRIERNLEKKLFDKYGNEGMRRAKKTVQSNFRQKGNAFVKINDRSSKAINKATAGKGKASTLRPR